MPSVKSKFFPQTSSPFEKALFFLGKGLYNGSNALQKGLLKVEQKRFKDIHYYTIGNPQNPPLVFFHGFGDSKDGFLISSFNLKKDYYLIIPDMPGFGDNPESPHQNYSLKYMAQTLAELFVHLELKKFSLLGNSMGGAIAMQFTLNNPDFVSELILLNSAGFHYPDVRSVFHEFSEGKNIFKIHSREDYRYLLGRVFHKVPPIPKSVFHFLYHHIESKRDWYDKMTKDLTEHINDVNDENVENLIFNHKAKEILCPTLLLWGENDSIFPLELAKRSAPLFPQGELVTIPNSGHAPQYETPRQYLKALRDFLKK